jgi:hypothetical protein
MATAARNKPKTRIEGELASAELIDAAVKRAEAQRGQAQTAKQVKARTKPVHGVDHSPHRASTQTVSHDVERDNDMPTQWREPRRLDAPPPRPGYVQRFVRFRSGSEEDAENFEEKLEEGWRPRKRSSVRKVHELTANTHKQHGEYYVKRGLILMELPEKLKIQRDRFYAAQREQMLKGVDRTMFKLNHRVMPLLRPERSTSVTQRARRGALESMVPGDEQAEA